MVTISWCCYLLCPTWRYLWLCASFVPPSLRSLSLLVRTPLSIGLRLCACRCLVLILSRRGIKVNYMSCRLVSTHWTTCSRFGLFSQSKIIYITTNYYFLVPSWSLRPVSVSVQCPLTENKDLQRHQQTLARWQDSNSKSLYQNSRFFFICTFDRVFEYGLYYGR